MDTIKHKLCEPPILAYPEHGSPYILDTDASNTGVGGILSQVQEGKERVICYGSKKLDKAQQNYCVTHRELLAVITFVTQLRHYLLGQEFLLRTDHGSLRWLCNFKQPEGQIARWLEISSQYNFKIVHRAGKRHQNADALSRIDEDNEPCEMYSAEVKLEDYYAEGVSVAPRNPKHGAPLALKWTMLFLFQAQMTQIESSSSIDGLVLVV